MTKNQLDQTELFTEWNNNSDVTVQANEAIKTWIEGKSISEPNKKN